MEIKVILPDQLNLEKQASASGFGNIGDYIAEIVRRDAERVAILEGIEDVRAGNTRLFSEFDQEFRKEKLTQRDGAF